MFTSLINLFFPEVCAGCENFLLAGESVICTACRHEIPMTNHHLTPQNEAFQKFYGKLPVEFAATMCYFHKKGIVQEMIHKLKYKRQEAVGETIGFWYGAMLNDLPIMKTVDAVIPVPLHKRRLRERGYNQTAQFGKALAESIGADYDDQLLVRNVYSKSQTRKNRSSRSANSQSVFGIDENCKTEGKHFLLVDDVLTTGATLESCGRALLQIENTRISIVCIAMTK